MYCIYVITCYYCWLCHVNKHTVLPFYHFTVFLPPPPEDPSRSRRTQLEFSNICWSFSWSSLVTKTKPVRPVALKGKKALDYVDGLDEANLVTFGGVFAGELALSKWGCYSNLSQQTDSGGLGIQLHTYTTGWTGVRSMWPSFEA